MKINEPAVNTPPEVDPAEALRTHVAYHEAGHAVVAALLDHHIEWAAIRPARGLQGGRVVNQGPAPTTTRAVVEDMAITCAGLVAETLSPHQHLLRDASLNRIDDLLGITGTVTTYFPAASTQEQQQLWQVAHDCAADLLEQPENKVAVHSLAALLLQQGEVSHEEVMALIHQARDQEQATRLSAQFAPDRRLWRWYLCSLGVVFIVEMTAIGLLPWLSMCGCSWHLPLYAVRYSPGISGRWPCGASERISLLPRPRARQNSVASGRSRITGYSDWTSLGAFAPEVRQNSRCHLCPRNQRAGNMTDIAGCLSEGRKVSDAVHWIASRIKIPQQQLGFVGSFRECF